MIADHDDEPAEKFIELGTCEFEGVLKDRFCFRAKRRFIVEEGTHFRMRCQNDITTKVAESLHHCQEIEELD